MKTKLSLKSVGAAAALALALVAGGGTAATAAGCLDRYQIQDAVSSGQIKSLDTVLAEAGIDPNAEILSVQVCDEGGGLIYVIGVLNPDGTARNVTLSAQ